MGLMDGIKKLINEDKLGREKLKYEENGRNTVDYLYDNTNQTQPNASDYKKVENIHDYLKQKVENGELFPIKVGRTVNVGYEDNRICFCSSEDISFTITKSAKDYSSRIKTASTETKEQEFQVNKGDVILMKRDGTIVGKPAKIECLSLEEFQKSDFQAYTTSSYNILNETLSMLYSQKTPEDVMQGLVDKQKSEKLVENGSLDEKLNNLSKEDNDKNRDETVKDVDEPSL